jgi:hypothetical protein
MQLGAQVPSRRVTMTIAFGGARPRESRERTIERTIESRANVSCGLLWRRAERMTTASSGEDHAGRVHEPQGNGRFRLSSRSCSSSCSCSFFSSFVSFLSCSPLFFLLLIFPPFLFCFHCCRRRSSFEKECYVSFLMLVRTSFRTPRKGLGFAALEQLPLTPARAPPPPSPPHRRLTNALTPPNAHDANRRLPR